MAYNPNQATQQPRRFLDRYTKHFATSAAILSMLGAAGCDTKAAGETPTAAETTTSATATPGAGEASSATQHETNDQKERVVGNIDISNLGSRAKEKAIDLINNPKANWGITDDDLDPKNPEKSYAEADFVVNAALMRTGQTPEAIQEFINNAPGYQAPQFGDWALENILKPKIKEATSGVYNSFTPGMNENYRLLANRSYTVFNINKNQPELNGKRIAGLYNAIWTFDEESLKITKTGDGINEPFSVKYSMKIQETVNFEPWSQDAGLGDTGTPQTAIIPTTPTDVTRQPNGTFLPSSAN